MTDKKSYEVYVIKKIPYLTNGLLTLFVVSALIFLFFYGGISSEKASPEIKVFYLEHTSTVKLLYGAAFFSITFFILFISAKQNKKAIFVFHSDAFEIIYKKSKIVIPLSTIRQIYCNDSEDYQGRPNEKFTITIESFKNQKTLIRLRNSSDLNQFSDKLLTYDELKIEYVYSKWANLN